MAAVPARIFGRIPNIALDQLLVAILLQCQFKFQVGLNPINFGRSDFTGVYIVDKNGGSLRRGIDIKSGGLSQCDHRSGI